MFSTKLARATPRATAAISNSTTGAQQTTRCLATRPTPHQRRQSSSKASCPPDNPSKPAPAAKAIAGEEEPRSPVPAQKSAKGRSRGGYRRVNATGESKKAAIAEPVDQFAGLPSVPTIQNLDIKDFGISAFFSLHRPVSLTTTIPPPTTQENFSNIFEARQRRVAWENGNSAERRPEDVIYTLHNTIDTLENSASNAQDDAVRWEILHESPSNNENVKHLDGVPRLKSLDELVAQFKPFRAPPPPQPFPEMAQKLAAMDKKAARKSARARPKQETFTATITVTESTDFNGQKTYSASSSPIVRLPDPTSRNQEQAAIREPGQRQRQPFLTRMRARQSVSTSKQQLLNISAPRSLPVRREPSGARQERMRRMSLISVKRQRKLKMKKHKYKKLMKRTRNLRRRLERN